MYKSFAFIIDLKDIQMRQRDILAVVNLHPPLITRISIFGWSRKKMTGAQNVALNVATFLKGHLSQKRGRFSRTLLQGFIGLIMQFKGSQTFFDVMH